MKPEWNIYTLLGQNMFMFSEIQIIYILAYWQSKNITIDFS